MQAGIDGVTRATIEWVGPELSFGTRAVLANLWLFGPPLQRLAARDPVFDALLRTTTAATVIEGGTKTNVLPTRARAVVNHRIHPRDRIEDVVAHVEAAIADERVQLRVGGHGVPRDPSPISRLDSEPFALLQRTIGEIFGDAIVAPNLGLGGTDARHFHAIASDVYRLSPFRSSREALRMIHGTNERVEVESLGDAVRFFRRIIQNASS